MKLLQKDFARQLGVDTNTITNWERNRCQPRFCLFPRIVQFLGYNPFPAYESPSITEATKAYRVAHGLSQKRMAKTLRIDPTTLVWWEKGKNKPAGKLLQRLTSVNNSLQSD